MKVLSIFGSAVVAATALLSLIPSTAAHMAMSNPPGQAGPWTKNQSGQVHAFIGFKGKKFPCGDYPKGPVTKYRAGQTINVRFWVYGVPSWTKFPPKSGLKTARHGGGACEFSLSYNGGKTWKVIGQYTETCPDVYHEWPVQIPKNVPSCTDSNKCLFSWSWIAYATNQFYHHCANIEIAGDKEGKLPELDMTVVDIPGKGIPKNVHARGDGIKTKSKGPSKREKEQCTNGFYAYGGKAGKRGIDLRLARN
ncbi:hypothetical protein BGX29_001730 [Mortierella sp. GBA35]|nr:hypothetical protein BGX23_001302 [Mortierella sp. AD031]KAF9085864.1 hypothetical protein BGX29_001730 [Mortierella sp. GBA35]KAG0205289.1 hypothetical protein BGX33_007997 [Mortierella sp. NVP41]